MTDATDPVIELIGADIPRAEHPSARPAVKEVHWKIPKGSFWAVGAFAGAGKTDLLLTAAGLQRPLRGQLALFGKPITEMTEGELVANRLKVAMIFADGRLFSHMTVIENIALPLEYHGEIKSSNRADRIESALRLAGIVQLADKFPRQVPRALHQRVALARALALLPDVLLVDNPLGGVDQRSVRWWIDFLCAANKGDDRIRRHMTIVVATDDLRPWIDAAKDFAVLRDRHFEVIGDREALKTTSEAIVHELLAPAFDQ
jgi:ABC-type transporter Mla maintaining outer membrane lipid asymmetry ATPase subunit MlaF